MGGGSAIRSAAKAAGISVFNGGFRGRLTENPLLGSGKHGRVPVLDTVQSDTDPVDDWEFAGGEEGVFAAIDDDKSRVVFGDPPTLEEAKEATVELKEVLEKSYLSSPSFGQVSGLSCVPFLSSSRIVQAKAYDAEMPKHAIQAFKFLSESQPLQNVVASIAADRNVWHAVLSNLALQEFLESHNMNYFFQRLYPEVEGSSAGDSVDDDDDNKSRGILEISDIWKNIKVMVVDMMNDLSDLFQDLLGGQPSNRVSVSAITSSSFFAKALGPSLMGLVLMVMMVVAFRRSPA